MIIGVTGSRDWKDRKTISDAFDDAVEDHGDSDPVVVIEGGAPGADFLCRAEATYRGWHVATVKALWGHYGKSRAGHVRNNVMVYLGANASLWLAFINPCIKEDCPDREHPHDSHGAVGCAAKAEKAGIDVRRYGWRY